MDVREGFAADGFVVVPGVLTRSEVVTLRTQVNESLDAQGVHKSGGTVLPNAAAEAPGLSWIFSHPAIIAIVREAADLDKMIFTMEADLHRNYVASKWHKDSGEQMMQGGYFGRECFDTDDCRVVKVALYLQDYTNDKRVLHVRPGSYRSSALDQGTDLPIRASAGDAVLFDVRLTHRGVEPSLIDSALFAAAKVVKPKAPAALAAQLRRKQMRLTGRPDRVAVYFAFGAANENSERFAERNMRRQLSQLGREAPPLPADLVGAFSAAGIGTVELG